MSRSLSGVPQHTSPTFLSGGGEVGALIRSHDWSSTSLGAPEGWPQALKTAVGLMLGARQPVYVAWGPDLLSLYNDAYLPIVGSKHPGIGLPFRELWAEIWDEFRPYVEATMAGDAQHFVNMPIELAGRLDLPVGFFTFSYTALRDERGEPAGFYCAATETTQAVLSGNRRDLMLELDERLRDVPEPSDLSFAATRILGETMDAARVGYGTVNSEAGTITVKRNWFAPGFDDVARVHHFADYGSFIDDLQRGDVVANADVKTDPRTSANAAAFSALQIRAHLEVPVMENGQLVSVMFVHSGTPRVWTHDEVAFVSEFAKRTHAAIARRKAEQKLRESEERLRAFVEAVPGVAYAKDRNGRMMVANHGVTELLGKPPEEYIGKTDAEFLDDESQGTAVMANDRRIMESKVAEQVEEEIQLPDGTPAVWLSSKAPLLDSSGRVIGLIGSSIDITARRRAEEALQKLNETLEERVAERSAERDQLWNLSQDMFARADYSGMMSAVNPAWTAALGWTEQELLEREYASFMHPDDLPPTIQAIERMAATQAPTRFENRLASRDGSWKHFEWTLAPERDGLNFIAVGRDLSLAKAREAELKAAQVALRQAQKMEAMGQLTGGVAHDFNNLLTPIVGTLDLLQRKEFGSVREQRLIAGAAQSAERARTLVQRLLAFARRQPLQAVAVDVAQLVTGMSELLASTTGPQVKVVLQVAGNLPPAMADANQLEMALLNLAVNARDSMAEGGTLEISAKPEAIVPGHRAGLEPGDYIQLSIADSGSGMDEDTLARAIEPFFSTKGVGKGTGLGLSMVHGLASQLGGALTIQSKPGSGTIIELWLPQSSEIPKTADPVKSASLELTSASRALLVEDEELVRMSTADMLADLGYIVVEAASGEEAMSLIDRGEQFDVLVTDHLMPGMSGTRLARQIRLTCPHLPVLLVSGYAENEGIDPDLPRLTKPFRKAELASALGQLSALI